MAGEPWKRIKTSAATNAPGVGGTITVTFDESTPLDSSHALVAIAQWSGASTDASNSWGATGIPQSGSNGANNYSAAYIVPGDAAKNGITFTFSVAQAQAAVVLMAFEGFVTATPHTAGVSNPAASTTSTAGPPSTATSIANTIAIVTTALSTGGGGTWGTWDSGFFSSPISLSRLHVGAKALTATGQSPSSSITHTSSRAKRVMAFTIQGTAPSANTPPTVSAGADLHALVGDTVSIPATAADSDGTIATYNWSVISCDVTAPTLVNGSTATVSFVPDRPMTLTLRCTVEDNLGASASDDVTVRVSIARAPSGINKGLIAEWNFAEASAPFYTQDGALPLSAVGSVPRVTTPWGYGVDIDGSPNYLRVLAANIGALNMGDWGGKVTVAAWVKRQDVNTGFVAGPWQEDSADPRRQYGLFIDLGAYGGSNMSCFHVSKLGGPTPGFPFSKDYAASGATVTNDVWEFHVGTYDGAEARSYLNGAFTAYPSFTDSDGMTYAKNPYAYADGLNAAPVDFTVGAVKLTAGMGNFFDGQIAKLRVWDRAITSAEVAALYAAEIPGAITGTAASTLAAATSSATGTVALPAITGVAASTLAPATSSATGTRTVPAFTGTAASGLSPATSSAAGTVAPPGISGTVSSTLAPATSSATGTRTVPAFTGTAASGLSPATSSATGTAFAPGINGLAASVLLPATSSATGTRTVPAFTGTATSGLSPATSSATGTRTVPAFTGSAASTLAPPTSAAAGTIGGVAGITGMIASALAAAVSSAVGISTGPAGIVIVETYTFVIRPWNGGAGHDVDLHKRRAYAEIVGRPLARGKAGRMIGPDVIERADGSAAVTYSLTAG